MKPVIKLLGSTLKSKKDRAGGHERVICRRHESKADSVNVCIL